MHKVLAAINLYLYKATPDKYLQASLDLNQ